jgi:flagellar basal-body rod modification protein FlgD
MATTDPIIGTNSADALTSSDSSVARKTGGALGKDDFLKLLVGQMKNMDPLSESGKDPSESMNQMTQFSMLEQITNLTQANKTSSSVALLGKTVTYNDAAGQPVTGTVESVETVGDKVTLTVGGKGLIDPATVRQVS